MSENIYFQGKIHSEKNTDLNKRKSYFIRSFSPGLREKKKTNATVRLGQRAVNGRAKMGSMAWLFSFILFTSLLSSTISDDGTGGIVTNQDGDASLRVDDQSAPEEGDSHPTDDHGSDQHYHDTTNFLTGVNGWDFIGSWAKYDLKVLQEAQVAVQAVPLVPDSQDQGVFICQVRTTCPTRYIIIIIFIIIIIIVIKTF